MKVTVLPLFVAALGLGMPSSASFRRISTDFYTTLSVSEVSASPLRIYILGTGENPSAVVAGNAAQPVPIEGSVMPMRWGHAAAGSQQVPRPLMMAESSEGSDDEKDGDDKHKHMGFHGIGRGRGRMMKGGCGRHGLRGKALALQNWLRTKFGMEPIAPHPHFRRPHHHFHHHHEHEEGVPVPETVEGEENAPDSLKVLPFPMHTSEQDGEVQAPHHHGHHFHHFRRPHSFSGRLSKALMTLGPWEGRVVAFVIGESTY